MYKKDGNQKWWAGTLIAMIALTAGCSGGGDGGSGGGSGSAVSPSTGTNTCSAPVTRIVDFGERTNTGTTMALRGSFSDIALNPVNSYPAVAYTDAGALTLKYIYWDGSRYRQERIVGGQTTNWVRVAFLSQGANAGVPIVFWSNGATGLYMAVRSTSALTSAGSWTVTLIENVAAQVIRSVEVAVSPLDQVGIFYVNSANTAGRVVICNANCNDPANYAGMGLIGNTIASSATASATAMSSDIKFCNNGSGAHLPYVAFAGTVNSRIARCTQTTLANCLTPANWAIADITDGTNATGVGMTSVQLHIDSTANAAFHAVARRDAATDEVRAYTQNAAGCATQPLAFSATSRQIFSGANAATIYMKLARDSGNRWHVIMNDGVANLRYFNELTGTITAAWNAGFDVVGTTEIPAASATRAGLVVDNTGDQLLLTYGRTTTAAAGPATAGNLVLAYNQCPTGGTGCGATSLNSPSNAAGMIFHNIPMDITGQMQLVTAQFPNVLSTAVTSTGSPAVAYVDFSIGSSTTGRLKYAFRSGSSASTGNWTVRDMGIAIQPSSVALAFDHDNLPYVAYFDQSTLMYFLASNSETDGSGVWRVTRFPIAAATAATLPAVNNVGLAMHVSGGVSRPMMFVSNSGAATRVVRAALYNQTTGAWIRNTQLDTGTNVFGGLSSDYDSLGNIVVAYHDTTNSTVRYSRSSNGGVSWNTATAITTAQGGLGVDIRLNPSNHRPAISFLDRAGNLTRYRFCTTDIASCANIANWSPLGTGIVDGTSGISGLATATENLAQTSLSFTSAGQAWLIYPYGAGASVRPDLMFSNIDSVTGVFTTAATLAAGVTSNISTPLASTAANFGVGGWNARSVRAGTGSLHTAHVGPGNFLYVTSCGD